MAEAPFSLLTSMEREVFLVGISMAMIEAAKAEEEESPAESED